MLTGGSKGTSKATHDDGQVPSALTTRKKGKKGEDDQQPSTSSYESIPTPKKDNMMKAWEIGQEGLERGMVESYLAKHKDDTGVSNVPLIIYRMNIWKNHETLECKLEDYQGREEIEVQVQPPAATPHEHIITRDPLDYHSQCTRWVNVMGGISMMSHCKPYIHICRNKNVSSPHCVITGAVYPDDHVWIEDENSQHGTFLNGERIPSGEKHRLVDGDIIGLGASHDDPRNWRELKEKRGYVFKIKSLHRSRGETSSSGNDALFVDESDGPTFSALNNVVILDKILTFFNHQELKTTRMINKYWECRANCFMFPRTIATFHFPRGPDNNPVHGRVGKCMSHQKKHDWRDLYQQNTAIIPRYGIENYSIDISGGMQYSNDVQWLADNLRDSVRCLHLNFTLDTPEDATQIVNLLTNLPNLETLFLDIWKQNNVFPNLPATTFPGVKNLGIQLHRFRNGFNIETDPFYSSLLKVFPNVQNLYDMDVSVLKDLLETLIDTEHPTFWKKLTRISADFGKNSHIYQQSQGEELFTAIANLKQNLTSLVLVDIQSMWLPNAKLAFEVMLTRHAKSLERLELKFMHGYDNRIVVIFPSFPNLKILVLDTKHGYNPCPTRIIFPSGPVCYQTDLPQIRRLNVIPWYHTLRWGKYSQIYLTKRHRRYDILSGEVIMDLKYMLDIFVPQDSTTISHTMTWFDFLLEEDKCTQDNQWFRDFVERFHRMFPHVNHPVIIKGLKLFNLE